MQRPTPPRRRVSRRTPCVSMSTEDRERASSAAKYIGSPEHKLPNNRGDGSICPPHLEHMRNELTRWLKEAIHRGNIGGAIEGGFPRYAWHREQDSWFEARLTNQTLGEYKGYPITSEEAPKEYRESACRHTDDVPRRRSNFDE